MKKTVSFKLFAAALLATSVLFTACNDKGGGTGGAVEMSGEMDKVSYSIGYSIGQNFKSSAIEGVNTAALAKAIEDVMSGAEPAITEAEMATIMETFQKDMQVKMEAQRTREIAENSAEATAFLEENAGKDGIVSLPSGLQYQVITEGSGASPTDTDTVKCHYAGTFIDGTSFDSSYDRGEPTEFPVGGVIPGWTEALKLMKVGAKWKVFIPPQLAYDEQGRPGIPPNKMLVFEMELLEIVAPK